MKRRLAPLADSVPPLPRSLSARKDRLQQGREIPRQPPWSFAPLRDDRLPKAADEETVELWVESAIEFDTMGKQTGAVWWLLVEARRLPARRPRHLRLDERGR